MYYCIDSYLRIGIIEDYPEQGEHCVAQGVEVPRVGALRVGVPLAYRLVDHVENADDGAFTYDFHYGRGHSGVRGPENYMKVFIFSYYPRWF